jgi:hypothetical protein
MNDPLYKLAGAALDKSVPYTWTTLDYDQIHKLLECHGQMIVKECAAILIKEATENCDEGTETHYALIHEARWMKRYFGVEE